MGVRIALGAGRREILGLVMGQALRVTGWGLVLGTAAALAVGRAIASLLYGVKPHDPLVLSLVILILGAVAAGGGYPPPPRGTKAAARGGPGGGIKTPTPRSPLPRP